MIFYFSATGNSLFAAQQIQQPSEKIISISQAIQQQDFHFSITEDEAIGFIFPVYFMGAPQIIKDFLLKLKLSYSKPPYVYLVLTYGGMPGAAGALFESWLKDTLQLPLSATFGILSVENYLPLFKVPNDAKCKKIITNSCQKIAHIKPAIQQRKKGHQVGHHYLGQLMTYFTYPFYHRARKTSSFRLSPTCISCKKCVSICPEKVINFVDNKPNWQKSSCSLCLACLHHCPVSAIDYGRSKGKKRFIHPDINPQSF